MDYDLNTIKNFFIRLGFEETQNNIFLKRYPKHNNYEIKIQLNEKDPKKSEIFYNKNRTTTEGTTPQPTGEIHLGDFTTSNFQNPENFVVLEAVNRLLEIGYKPENIHLERKWRLGRTGKSGKADITVYYSLRRDRLFPQKSERDTFMIIECKTWGEEYEKEKRRLFKNGGQLFSYFQQERSTKILALYTSIFEEDEITYDSLIIKVEDDAKLVEKYKKEADNEDTPCSFADAPDVPSLVDVWKRVYNQYVFKHGIFEPDAGIYSLDLKPLKKKDLIPIRSSKGLFNAFAEILRHHNISDNANAFNKMMSLFLCKIVDEETKNDDDILDFQIKLGESFEEVVDRLQRLYQIGMKKYLGVEDFVYYSDEDIRKIIKLYPQRTKLEEIEEIFKQIKYYTNNEFAFKEVHNKKLFYQNALILSEVIELLQNYRIKYSHKNQILGDFFELLLNHGVKQSEGQFFTPLPLVRFMIISVAIDKYTEKRIKEGASKEVKEEPLPKILDYACGVAHFLTEAIDEINKVIENKKLDVKFPWEERYIFGIEKDYRLARTAKIACFLNGDGSANIIFGDGLDDYSILGLDKKKFDFVLTNPPYSVKKFKNYLDVKPKYELLKYLTENSSEIEVLFVERAKQMLIDGGRAAIILPSSILTNTGVYSKTRELILKYFEIKGIAEFGSQTFIATGTNVVVMFLERRPDWFCKDREKIASEIFEEKRIAKNDYVDVERIFGLFIDYRDLPKEDYKKFVFNNELTEELLKTDIFESYKSWFNSLTKIKNLKKRKAFKEKSKAEQKKELEALFKKKIIEKEKEKFFYFSLMFKMGKEYGDPRWYKFQKTVVARAPSKTDVQKQYLGYEFNKRRGFEGIEIYKDEDGKLTTKLYDDENYYNPKKVASYIRKNFEESPIDEIDEEIKPYLEVFNLPDIFDFERVGFEKQIKLNTKKKIVIKTRWKLKMLKDIVTDIFQGLTFPKEAQSQTVTSKKILTSTHIGLDGNLCFEKPIYLNKNFRIDTKYKLRRGDILISTSSGSLKHLGKSAFTKHDLDYYAGGFCAIIRGTNYVTQKYISLILRQEFFREFINNFKGQNINNLSIEELKKFKIPVPPKDIQKKIAEKIEALEKEEERNEDKINTLERNIKDRVKVWFNKYSLERIEKLYSYLKRGKSPKYGTSDIQVIKSGQARGYYDFDFSKRYFLAEDFKIDKDRLLKMNDILINSTGIGTAGRVTFFILTDGKYTVDSHITIFRTNEKVLPKFAFYCLAYGIGFKEIEKLAKGQSGQIELSLAAIKGIEIPVPDIKEQERLIDETTEIELKIEELGKRNEEIEREKMKILERNL